MEDEDDMPEGVNEPGAYGMFEDYNQATQHLSRRIVLFNNRAASVVAVNMPTEKGLKATISLNDPHNGGFNAKPFIDDPGFNRFRFDPLGWTNHSAGPVFGELLPIRQTRRGYGDENTKLWGFSNNEWANSSMLGRPDDVSVYNFFFSDGFTEMLKNEYPDVADVARELFGRTDIAMAVSRRFMLQSDDEGYTWLWRETDKIGMLVDAMTVQLSKRTFFLKEEVQDEPCFNGVYIK